MRAPTDAIRRRTTDVAWAAGGLGGMLVAGSAVEPETASAFEIAMFRVFNDAPDFLYPVVWPLMQYGTFITIPVATVIALLFHKVRLAVEMAVAGVAVYELAKLAKDAFPRGRPGAVLAEAHLRGAPAGQQGFPSGHAAVSAALGFILFAYLPGRWRWVPLPVAGGRVGRPPVRRRPLPPGRCGRRVPRDRGRWARDVRRWGARTSGASHHLR